MLSLLAKSGIDLDGVDSDELEAILDSDSSIDEILDDVKVEPKYDATTCSSTPPPVKGEVAENSESSDFVRRSVRPRRSLNRFGDYVDPLEAAKLNKIVRQISPVEKKPKLSDKPESSINGRPRGVGIRTLKPRVRLPSVEKSVPSSSSSEDQFFLEFSSASNESDDLGRHCLEPDLLLAYALRYGPPNPIPPNKFGVRLAVGPDEYATVEAVEYLRSLGYPDIEMDVSTANSDEMNALCDELNKRILSITARNEQLTVAKLHPKAGTGLEQRHRSLIRNSVSEDTGDSEWSRDEFVIEKDLFPPSQTGSSRNSSNSDVEVEIIECLSMSDSSSPSPVLDPKLPSPPIARKVKPQPYQRKPQGPQEVEDVDRNRHNVAERLRRVEMREQFDKLNEIVFASDVEGYGLQHFQKKAAKVHILEKATECISKLHDTSQRLACLYDQSLLEKNRLEKHLRALKDVVSQRSKADNGAHKKNTNRKSNKISKNR